MCWMKKKPVTGSPTGFVMFLLNSSPHPHFPFHTHTHTLFAEREGFEPPDPCRSTVFKTAAIDRSAISPPAKVQRFLILTNAGCWMLDTGYWILMSSISLKISIAYCLLPIALQLLPLPSQFPTWSTGKEYIRSITSLCSRVR